MLQTSQLFDGPLLLIDEYLGLVEDFSERTCFFYKAIDAEKRDLFPELPLSVETYFTHNVAYIIGLVQGDRPGKCLLRGVVKIAGYRDVVHYAYEPILGVPAATIQQDREQVIKSLRRRLSRSVLVLADAAGMMKYAPLESVDANR
jgi:hypothetical protein